MTGHRHRYVLVFLATCASSVVAQDRSGANALDLALARDEARVITTAGRTFRGLLDGFRDGRLSLRIATDGGEVGYSFAREEISALVLPGADTESRALELWDRGNAAEALPLLEALGRQRIRYLPLLDESQRRPLIALVRASDAAGDPLATIGYARAVMPFAGTDSERTPLDDAILTAHVRLGMRDEVRRLAQAWCAGADPAGGSVLGWTVVAGLAFDEGDFERALWIALQPVVFSTHLPTAHLDECYALAIAAADRLGKSQEAFRLAREMRERALDWPADPRVAEAGSRYAQLDAEPEERALETSASSLVVYSLIENFDDVRKLVVPPLP